MSVVLINNVKVLVTMDDECREIKNGAIVIRNNIIEKLGSTGQVGRELERDYIGSLEPGKAADLVAYPVDGIEHAGSGGDPLAGLLTCAPVPDWLLVINGRVVLEQGKITGLDLQSLVSKHNAKAEQLLQKAGLSR